MEPYGVMKDLKTLTTFSMPPDNRGKIGYSIAIFLVFGDKESFISEVQQKAKIWANTHSDIIKLSQIKFYWHREAGKQAQKVDFTT